MISSSEVVVLISVSSGSAVVLELAVLPSVPSFSFRTFEMVAMSDLSPCSPVIPALGSGKKELVLTVDSGIGSPVLSFLRLGRSRSDDAAGLAGKLVGVLATKSSKNNPPPLAGLGGIPVGWPYGDEPKDGAVGVGDFSRL